MVERGVVTSAETSADRNGRTFLQSFGALCARRMEERVVVFVVALDCCGFINLSNRLGRQNNGCRSECEKIERGLPLLSKREKKPGYLNGDCH